MSNINDRDKIGVDGNELTQEFNLKFTLKIF